MSSGFISESEIVSQRQKRQEEWEKVRTSEQPIEVPEEEYDPRSLFDRLQEQKQKKELEYEEAHKLKNMIKGLDDDEVEFLDLVDQNKYDEEIKLRKEEKQELNEFRMKRKCLEEKNIELRIQSEIKTTNTHSSNNKISSQSKLLAGALIKKSINNSKSDSNNSNSNVNNSNSSSVNSNSNNTNSNNGNNSSNNENSSKRKLSETDEDNNEDYKIIKLEESIPTRSEPLIECIGILPGIGSYDISTDSDGSSSDFESECHAQQIDLLGRKIIKKKYEDDNEDGRK